MRRIGFSLLSGCIALTGSGFLAAQDWQPVVTKKTDIASGAPSIQLGKAVLKSNEAKPLDLNVAPVNWGPNDNQLNNAPRAASSNITVNNLRGGILQAEPIQAKPMPTPTGNSGIVTSAPSAGSIGTSTVIHSPVVNQGTPVMIDGGSGISSPWFGGEECGEFCPVPAMGIGYNRPWLTAPHGSPGKWYASFDFMAINLNEDVAPALVTQGDENNFGAINVANPASVLYGGQLPIGALAGGRVTMGVWFNPCQSWGLMGSFFLTGTRSNTFSAASDANGNPLLARPFFDQNPGVDADGNPLRGEASELVSFPGELAGRVDVTNTSRMMGADMSFRWNLLNNLNCCKRIHWHIDAITGVKYLQLDESLNIREDLLTLVAGTGPNGLPANTRIIVTDNFTTRNTFIGGQVGLLSELRLGRFFFNSFGKLAFGTTNQRASITGTTQFDIPQQGSVIRRGGLLALPSNDGTRSTSNFGFIPEVGFQLGMNLTCHWRIYVGYEAAWWTNVARPGQLIDRNVNSANLPTSGRDALNNAPRVPAFQWNTSTVTTQALTAGMQWTW